MESVNLNYDDLALLIGRLTLDKMRLEAEVASLRRPVKSSNGHKPEEAREAVGVRE